jgi:hypothetical protein
MRKRKAWEKEQQVNKDAAKAIREFRKDPDGVSKKTEEAIKRMGMRPDQKLVTKLAAQVVAYRQESRGDKGVLHDKGVSTAVRSVVVEYTKPSTKGEQHRSELKGAATRLRKTTPKTETMY